MEKHVVDSLVAHQIWNWLQTRGGLYLWSSVNLSNPGGSWTGPANDKDGNPSLRPTWQAADKPDRHITSPDDILVVTWVEHKRHKVAVECGDSFSLVVSDGGSRKIRKTLAKLHQTHSLKHHDQTIVPTYTFDYPVQEVVYLVPGAITGLAQWIAANPEPKGEEHAEYGASGETAGESEAAE